MGKKSRMKRERREARAKADEMFKRMIEGPRGENVNARFKEKVKELRSLLESYVPKDAALAIAVSDLWPSNISSPIKHIFAWAVLVDAETSCSGTLSIDSYEDFKSFSEALLAVLPEFPTLEDFIPSSDWGQVKIRLGGEFVPMFYGSCIERTSDFVEAFRITQAGNQEALADMDLAIAIQSHVIRSMPEFSQYLVPDIELGHIEVPPEHFWTACRKSLLSAEDSLDKWRELSSGRLDVRNGSFNAPLESDAFGNACMQGLAMPFFGFLYDDEHWLPIGIRNAPGHVIDIWSNQENSLIDPKTHWALSRFIEERFEGVISCPTGVRIGDESIELPISGVLNSGSNIYVLIACRHADISAIEKTTQKFYAGLQRGEIWAFKLPSGGYAHFSSSNSRCPSHQQVKILLVMLQSGTGFGFFDPPEPPLRAIPLADFITIFDSVHDPDELERFWMYVDEQSATLSPFSRGLADLFASFRDSYGVLVEGALRPTVIALDPHWGSNWRFGDLSTFWAKAPRRFPDETNGWLIERAGKSVAQMSARNRKTLAYSVEIGECTVQALMNITDEMSYEDGRMLDMFIQVFSDSLDESREIVLNLPIFNYPHIVILCETDPAHTIDEVRAIDAIDSELPVISSVCRVSDSPLIIQLYVNVLAVEQGLFDAKDATFEVECLLEALNALCSVCGIQVPEEIVSNLRSTATRLPRFHLQVLTRHVDVPQHANPVIPSHFEYKLARRQLALGIQEIGLTPGRYELEEAKNKIDKARDHLRLYIEERLEKFDSGELVRNCIEQHDVLLSSERFRIQQVRQSMSHAVDYDRVAALAEARKDFGTPARHYRYLLEKVLSSSPGNSTEAVKDSVLRELIGLIDWYMVLAGASDALHNEVDVAGVEIDDSFIPLVFYSDNWESREAEYRQEEARSRLGIGITDEDVVEGDLSELLDSKELRGAFQADLGFELRQLLQTLVVLSQPISYGLATDLAFSYTSSAQNISERIKESIEGVTEKEASLIIDFLTLSASEIRHLHGKSSEENDVPFWEHSKRLHRYSIRPLVPEGEGFRWGAEQASRSLHIWTGAVRDGFLPGEFAWLHINRAVRNIKENIERQLEVRTEQICRRYTPYVVRGIDFFRRFKRERFENVGDFDVLAYWPASNTLVAIECKYNQPPYCVKDSRRLRDRIFGRDEVDRKGQFSRIAGRRNFLREHREHLLNLLDWPTPQTKDPSDIELYVSRDVYWWMIHPPYPVVTSFIRVDSLDTWLSSQRF